MLIICQRRKREKEQTNKIYTQIKFAEKDFSIVRFYTLLLMLQTALKFFVGKVDENSVKSFALCMSLV